MRPEPDKRRNPVKVRLKPEKTGDLPALDASSIGSIKSTPIAASGRFDLGADRWLSHHVANHC
jgi:hypothetical protein